MTGNEINDLTADVKVCLCGALIEEIDSGGGFSYWAHVKRERIDYGHAAIPKLPMQTDPFTQGMAEKYREAKADFFGFDFDTRPMGEFDEARRQYQLTAQALAGSVLDDIDKAAEVMR